MRRSHFGVRLWFGMLVVFSILVSSVFPVFVATAAEAPGAAERTESAYFFEKRNKVLLVGVLPGQVVSVFGVDGTDTPVYDSRGVPNGQHAGDYLGPVDGKPLEIYIPLSPVAEGPHARVTRLFLWSGEQGWELLASLTPLESFPDTQVPVR